VGFRVRVRVSVESSVHYQFFTLSLAHISKPNLI
jgi:hypothetical protein